MKDLNSIILKNGIKALMTENEEAFKKSLINSLSLKLNSAISEVETSYKQKMMFMEEQTKDSDDIKYFINFVENYDSKIKNKLKLKNESLINITESELDSLKYLFNTLNAGNREKMVEQILSTPNGLKNTLQFYNKAKGLLS